MKSADSRTGFDVEGKKKTIADFERAAQMPDFWRNHRRAQEMMRELAGLKNDTAAWERMAGNLSALRELLPFAESDEDIAQEAAVKVSVLEKEVKQKETELFFSGKYDKGNAILSVYAGAGGKDAEDWAALLIRMYRRYAEKKEWQASVIHEHWGENSGPGGWGIKNAVIAIKTPYAYGYLKNESGVHRLVRISPFSAQSLRHTSFALVDVMPEFVAPEEVEINPEDLKIDFFRASGPGGQNVNKRETAVRITHVPTGIRVASQAERSQESNRDTALSLLRSKLYQLKKDQQENERQGVRQEKVKIEWGSQIRSYVMHPYRMVKDHRTGMETSQIEKVLDGELDEFIEAEIKQGK